MVSYYRFPTISFEERFQMIKSLDDVDEVVVQNEVSYGNILHDLKPDYMIHGDNWREGTLSHLREEVITTLNEWGGELVEVPFTYSETVTKCERKVKEKLMMPCGYQVYATPQPKANRILNMWTCLHVCERLRT